MSLSVSSGSVPSNSYADPAALAAASMGMEDAWGAMALAGPREMFVPKGGPQPAARTDVHRDMPFEYGAAFE